VTAAALPEDRIVVDDPRADDVRALLRRHLDFAYDNTPHEHVFALDIDGLLDPAVTFFSYRRAGRLLGVAALKQLDERHGELKSMHTAQAARRGGIGRALVAHLLGVARDRGYTRVSLETGTQDAFAPARALYAGAGFRPCGPFGAYQPSPWSAFLTIDLVADPA
jgi:putative acetyltransferase